MKILCLLSFLFLCLACSTDGKDVKPDLENVDVPFPKPSGLVVVSTGQTSSNISWQDNSEGEDGFRIIRNRAGAEFQIIGQVAANQQEYNDLNCSVADYVYGVYAFYKTRNSDTVFVNFSQPFQASLPKCSELSLQSSYARIVAQYTLDDDGGEKVESGIVWNKTGQPTEKDFLMMSVGKFNKGKSFIYYIPNFILAANSEYHFRTYAKNSAGEVYGLEKIAGVDVEKQPLQIVFDWEPLVGVNEKMPEEIKAFETTTMLEGRKIRAFYAIADLSTGKIGLKANWFKEKQSTSQHFSTIGDKCRILVNGGYFNTTGSESYSLLIDNGEIKAHNISILTRGTYSYPVTRSAFGVDANGKPSVKWVSSISASQIWAYDQPVLHIEGEPALAAPSKVFPAGGSEWKMDAAIGGAPILLKDGLLPFDFEKTSKGKYISNYELLQADIFDQGRLQPRTAIGYTADNKVVLLVVDGRQTESAGVTIDELALIMKGLGCTNALHLDGGGSSTMVAGSNSTPILINRPEGGSSQRPVPTTVGFVVK